MATNFERLSKHSLVILNSLPDSILLLDWDNTIQEANQRFESMFGVTGVEYLRQPLVKFVHQEYTDAVNNALREVRQTRTSRLIDILTRGAHNQYFDAALNLMLVTGDDGADLLVCMIRDIAHRREAEHRIAEERNLLRAIIDTVPDFIYVKDTSSRVVLSNRSHLDSLGIDDPASIIGKTGFDLFPPELAARFLAEDQPILTGEVDQGASEMHAVIQGRKMYWQTTKVPLRGLNNEIIGLVGVTHDITDLKKAEAALRQSQERLQLAVNGTRLGIWEWHFQDNSLYWDDRIYEIYGRQRTDLGASQGDLDKWARYIHPDDLPRLQAVIATITESDHLNDLEFRIIQPDRSMRHIKANGMLIRDADGKPVRMIGTNLDITERKESEESLYQSQERLKIATASAGIGIWDWDAVNDVAIWDDRMSALFGLTGMNDNRIENVLAVWKNTIHPEDREKAQMALDDAIAGKRPYDTDFRIVLANGTVRHLKGDAVVVRDADGRPVRMVGVNFDITPLKDAEETLRNALENERKLSDLKSRFVTTVSHEFRTPLAAILATADTLRHYRSRMDDSQIDARLEKIHRQVDRMKKLMEDVFNLERIQADRTPFNPQLSDLSGLVQTAIEEFQSAPAYANRIAFDTQTEPIMAQYDDSLMRHVVVNLIENALHFSPADTQIRVQLARDESNIIFSVQDKGMGIPPEDLSRLFQPFFRASNVGVIEGTGLGLCIADKSVRRHGGSINVETKEGVGSTFIVTLPHTPE